jgi:acetyl-CoA hydrolase
MSSELFSRIKKPIFRNLIHTPQETIRYFKNGMNLGWSGFAAVGYPKVVPIALAEHVEKNKLQKQLAFNLFIGASVGVETEDRWAKNEMIITRWPFISGKNIAKAINSGQIDMGDTHLSHFAQGFEFGFYCPGDLDIGIIEASEITEDGGIVCTAAVGAAFEIIQRARHLIIEINIKLPNFRGMHDFVPNMKPPRRRPYLITRVDDRIGSDQILSFSPEKIIAIVESTMPDNGNVIANPTDDGKRIADHLMNFFEIQVKTGKMPKNLLPLQSGVGNIPNAVLGGFGKSNFKNLVAWTEVLQDGMLDLLASGKMSLASTCSLSLTNEGFKRFYDNFDEYAQKIVLRPQEITNSGEIIQRLGCISMNAAIEGDMYGHINSTLIEGSKMVHGIGGSGDFFRNAYLSIAHFPSTRASPKDPTGISCIVPMCSHVDHTEHDINILVTEQGLADLRQVSPRKRAKLIIETCAHPDFKQILLDYYNFAEKKCIASGRGHEPQILSKVFQMYQNLEEHGTMKIKNWNF